MARLLSDREYYARREAQRKQQEIREAAEKRAKGKVLIDEQHLNYRNNYKTQVVSERTALQFRTGIKQSLLSEAIYSIFSKATPVILAGNLEAAGVDVDNVKHSIVNKFIEEEGTDNLLRRFKRTNVFLCECAQLVENTFKAVSEAVDPKCKDSLCFPGEVRDSFFDDLVNSTPDDVIDSIKDRVTAAMNSFLDENQAMKQTVTDIYQAAESRMQKTQNDTVKESYRHQATRLVNNARYKPITVLGEMVKKTAESVLKDKELLENFSSNGRIDMDKVVESAVIMYTFLETVNTLGLVEVNPAYIQKVIDKI